MKSESELPHYAAKFMENDKMGAHMGARFISLTHTECIYEYAYSPQHNNPNGILHGGALFAVMDSSQGMLLHAVLDDQFKAAATGTATIKYLAPVTSGKVRIVTTIKGKENRKLFVSSVATDDKGIIVAILEEIWIAFFK